MKKLYIMVLLPLLSCFGGTALAQSGTLTGKLLDEKKVPVPYANVAVMQANGTDTLLVTGAVTTAEGTFAIATPEPGTYFLRLSAIGFEDQKLSAFTITAADYSRDFGNLTLNIKTDVMQEVTVEGMRPTITQEADRMVVNVAGTALAAGSTAFDVLSKSPGVFIDHEGNIQLNGRAGVTIMIDGKLTYLSARDLRTLLEGMSAENIEAIEIIANPSAKYDAEGTSGILNITLKKNEQRGINGSVYSGYTYNGFQHGYSYGTTINYKSGRWNTFLNIDGARRAGGREALFTRVFSGTEETTYFDQVATGNYEVNGPPAVRAGADYTLTDKHSIGFMGYYMTNKAYSDFLTDTRIGTSPEQADLFIDANNYSRNRFTNYTANLHYLGKLDTTGTTLSADLDYVNIRNSGESDFLNFYQNLTTNQPATQDFLYTYTPNGFDIYAAKVDFTHPFSKDSKLELGAKASRVVSDNDSRFYFNNGEAPVLDPERTNHFIYSENIYAAYVNWSSTLGKRFNVQAGLRAEQTTSTGELLTTQEVTDRSYLELFPSVFVQQQVSENYGINYNYSRRIQRPNYGQLNPFLFYRDPYTYIQGNPYLRPEFTHAFGITHTYKKTYSLVLNYQLSEDVIAELPAIEEETTSTIYYTGNVDKSQELSITAIVPIKFLKKWESNNTLLASWEQFNAIVNEKAVVNEQVFYMLQSNHTVLLPLKFSLEANAAYLGPGVYALYRVEPRWWLHLGLKKSFLDDKLDVSVRVNDIFKTQRLKIYADVGEGNISYFDQYFRNRSLGLTLRYRFSKGQKVEQRKRGELDELNRTGN